MLKYSGCKTKEDAPSSPGSARIIGHEIGQETTFAPQQVMLHVLADAATSDAALAGAATSDAACASECVDQWSLPPLGEYTHTATNQKQKLPKKTEKAKNESASNQKTKI
jgi:hypothetical protein